MTTPTSSSLGLKSIDKMEDRQEIPSCGRGGNIQETSCLKITNHILLTCRVDVALKSSGDGCGRGSYLHSPVVGEVRLLLQLLLQEAVGLRLLGPHAGGLEATEVAGRVTLEQNWALLRVYGH